MLTINNVQPPSIDHSLNNLDNQVLPLSEINNTSSINNTTPLLENLALQTDRTPQAQSENTYISDTARSMLANEQAELEKLRDTINQNSLDQKQQYQDGIENFIYNAQRYSQQDVVPVFIENRMAIEAYSLVQNRVVATNSASRLEDDNSKKL